MAYRTYWIAKPWIMGVNYEGVVTVEDYEKAVGLCLDELERGSIYFLVDLSLGTSFPLSVTLIPSLLTLINHPNTACFAWVGANTFAKVGIPTIVRKPNRFFETRPRAIAYLYNRAVADQREFAVPPSLMAMPEADMG
jgi:hypothetical protein